MEQLADELRGRGSEVVIPRCDVASVEECEAVARSAVERFGRVDVLVNNAGVGPAGSALREGRVSSDSPATWPNNGQDVEASA